MDMATLEDLVAGGAPLPWANFQCDKSYDKDFDDNTDAEKYEKKRRDSF